MDCPICDGPVPKDLLEIARDYKLGIARMHAAEHVADALWHTTDRLRMHLELTDRDDRYVLEALAELREAQETFKAARLKR